MYIRKGKAKLGKELLNECVLCSGDPKPFRAGVAGKTDTPGIQGTSCADPCGAAADNRL